MYKRRLLAADRVENHLLDGVGFGEGHRQSSEMWLNNAETRFLSTAIWSSIADSEPEILAMSAAMSSWTEGGVTGIGIRWHSDLFNFLWYVPVMYGSTEIDSR